MANDKGDHLLQFQGLNIQLDDTIPETTKLLIKKKIIQALIKDKLIKMKVMSDNESLTKQNSIIEAKNEDEDDNSDGLEKDQTKDVKDDKATEKDIKEVIIEDIKVQGQDKE